MPADPRARFLISAATDFSKAQRSSNSFLGSLQRAASAASKAVAAVAVAGAVAITRLASQAAVSADALAKQADVLGISTQKLAAYQLAARLSGSTNESFEKGLRKLQKAIVDANNGLTTYQRAFEALKLDPAELQQLTPDQQFEALARSVANVKDQTTLVAVAYDLFGGRNTALINTLRVTGQQLNQIEADTQAWGVALSRVDAAKIEAANDAVERSRTALQGIGTTIALAFAPLREDVANSFADAAAEADGFKSEIASTMESLVIAANFGANAVRGIQLAFAGAKLAVLATADALDDFAQRVGGRREAVGIFGATADAATDTEAAITAAIDRTGARIDELLANFQNGETAINRFRERLAEAERSAQERITPLELGAGDQGEDFKIFGPQQRAQLEARLAAIQAGLRSETEAIAFAHSERATIITEALEQELITQQEHDALRVNLEAETAAKLGAIEKKRQDERKRLNEQTENAIQAAKIKTQDLAVSLLHALGAENRALAVAAIVIEKALSIQRVLLANRVAAELAFASQLIPGDPTSLARAAAAKAAVLAQGKISAALIAATGAVQIASLGRGSTGAPLGTPTNPLFTDSAGSGTGAVEARPTSVVQITINGDVIGDVAENMLTRIRSLIEEDDHVIFSRTSRQAMELTGT